MSSRFLPSTALAFAVCSIPVAATHAATLAWNGSGAVSGTATPFSLNTNWTPNGVPADGDLLTFGTTSNSRSPNNDLTNLALSGITISGNAYTISGNSLSVNGEIAFNAGGSNVSGFSAPIALTSSTTFNVSTTTSGRLELGGDVTGISDLVKTGAGQLRFTGSGKTYSGNTRVNEGIIDLVASLPNGAGKGDAFIASGAILESNNTSLTFNGINGAGTFQKVGNGSRTLTIGNGDANGSHSGTVNTVGSGGSTALTKIGTGTQVFSGQGNVSGALNVNGGRLIIDSASAGNFAVTGATTVAAAGTLGGTGVIAGGLVTVNGNLRPGGTLSGATFSESTAVLGVASLTLSGTAVTTLDIVGLARESQYDGVDVGTALTYGGTLNITGAQPGTFDLFNFGAVVPTGNFAAVNVDGVALTNLAGVWTGSSGGNSFAFSQATGDLIVTVPEPTTIAALAGASLIGLRRRRAR